MKEAYLLEPSIGDEGTLRGVVRLNGGPCAADLIRVVNGSRHSCSTRRGRGGCGREGGRVEVVDQCAYSREGHDVNANTVTRSIRAPQATAEAETTL